MQILRPPPGIISYRPNGFSLNHLNHEVRIGGLFDACKSFLSVVRVGSLRPCTAIDRLMAQKTHDMVTRRSFLRPHRASIPARQSREARRSIPCGGHPASFQLGAERSEVHESGHARLTACSGFNPHHPSQRVNSWWVMQVWSRTCGWQCTPAPVRLCFYCAQLGGSRAVPAAAAGSDRDAMFSCFATFVVLL